MMTDDNPQGLKEYNAEVAGFGPGEEGVKGYIGATSKVIAANHRDGWVAEQCLKFLDQGVDPQRPLFLYLSFLKPHAGFNVPKEFEDLYDIEHIPDTPNRPGRKSRTRTWPPTMPTRIRANAIPSGARRGRR